MSITWKIKMQEAAWKRTVKGIVAVSNLSKTELVRFVIDMTKLFKIWEEGSDDYAYYADVALIKAALYCEPDINQWRSLKILLHDDWASEIHNSPNTDPDLRKLIDELHKLVVKQIIPR